jgi:hypothetical protein
MNERSLPSRYLGALTLVRSTSQNHRFRLGSPTIIFTLAGLFLAPWAFAKITFDTIDPLATATDNGPQPGRLPARAVSSQFSA